MPFDGGAPTNPELAADADAEATAAVLVPGGDRLPFVGAFASHGPGSDWEALRDRVIGLGERSMRKTYYPELVQRLGELERFRLLLDHSRDAILLLELPSLRVVDATVSACTQLRRSRDELVGRPFAELVPSGSTEAVLASADRASGMDDGITLTTAFRAPDGGELPVEVSVRPVRFGDATYVVAVARDLTERLELEARLLEAAKMESLGRLAGGIAHDFNNLLTAILGNSEEARADLPSGHPALASIDEIVAAGQRATDLVRQLLVFARRQVVAPAVLDLNDLISRSEAMLRRLLGEDVEIRISLAQALPPILADATQMHQLLVNLVVNARDAMPEGGRLAITTSSVVVADGAEAAALGLRSGVHVELSVSDSGVGMSDATLAHIFEPFYTTKDPGTGTGLGLATCHGIVRQVGGAIAVSSIPGRGTTFRILMPATDGRATAPEPDSGDAAREGTETILFVEDDDAIRHLAVAGLRRRGYRVLEAASGQQALEVAAAQTFDLAVSDVVMPGMNGVELGRQLRLLRPAGLLILASGHPKVAAWAFDDADEASITSAPDDRLRAEREGEPDAFLAKPYTLEHLARLVRRVLDWDPPLS